MKRNFFLAAAASSFLLAGPVFAQQQTDHNAPVKLNKQEIIQLQQKLEQKGFKVGKADGIWGSKTSGALKEFKSKTTCQRLECLISKSWRISGSTSRCKQF